VIYFVSLFSKPFMFTKLVRHFAIALSLGWFISSALASDDPLFHSTDPLAPRDEWALLHQSPALNATDFYHRHSSRFYYYFKSGRELLTDPAYVGSLQVCLRNRGYYCGPIDGIMSEGVSDAIARLQKNYTQRVTGTLTVPVRRALNLP
jgi:Putative peptidoglycan binding domain